jgi:serine/threonine protein kinase
MALSLDQFCSQLIDSGLLSAEELSKLRESHQPADAEALARLLVKQKVLTAYQAQQAFAGKSRALVLGNYVILDKLGQGGMGMVLKARHRRMDRIVALKVLSPNVVKSPDMLARFHREVKAAARLEHSNIVAAYDADEARGTHFFVMQFVEGADLSSIVKKKGPLPVDQAINCILQAARGLDYAHRHGVIHRDIKPANLLLDNHGTVKVLDMGLARIEGETGSQAELTSTGAVMGTVDYMAPEQALSTKSADARSDIYSLGISLWYLLTARPAYEGDSLMARLLAHRETPPPSLKGARGEVPAALDSLFQKMIAKQPKDRCQTMTEVVAFLENCQRPQAISTKSTPSFTTGPSEESKLSEFMGVFDDGTDPNSPTRSVAREARTATIESTSSGSEYSVTVTSAEALEGTDPATQANLVDVRASSGVKGRWSRKAIGFAAVLLLAALLATVPTWRRSGTTKGIEPAAQGPGFSGDGSDALPQTADSLGTGSPKQIDPRNAQLIARSRDLATEIIKIGGRVSISAPGEPAAWRTDIRNADMLRDDAWVTTQAGLPSSDFWLRGVQMMGTHSSDDVARLVSCPTIEYLLAWGTPIDAPTMTQLAELPLRGLAIGTSPIGDDAVIALARSSSIEYLDLGRTKLSDACLPALGRMRQLAFLSLYETRVTDAGTSHLGNLKQLKHLLVIGTGVTAQGVSVLKRELPGCVTEWMTPDPGSPPPASQVEAHSLTFDGIDDYVDLTGDWEWDGKELTFEAWLVPPPQQDIVPPAVTLMALEQGDPATGPRARLIQTLYTPPAGGSKQQIQVSNPAHNEAFVSTNILVPEQPTHVAAVWRGRETRLFINGKQQPESTYSYAFKPRRGDPYLWLGALREDAREMKPISFWKGSLRQVRITSKAVYDADFVPAASLSASPETVALYRFEEASGDVLKDSSGNNRHGKIHGAKWSSLEGGGVSPGQFPADAVALEFSGQQSYVEIPNVGLDLERPYTIEAWVATRPGKNRTLAILRRGPHVAHLLHGFSNPGWEAICTLDAASPTAPMSSIKTTAPVADLQLQHVALVCDPVKKSGQLFVDGVPAVGSISPTQLQIDNALDSPNLVIGCFPAGDLTRNGFLEGRLHEFRVSQSARYSAGFKPTRRFEPDADTLALFHFDEGSGTEVRDASGNGHHGKVVGAKWFTTNPPASAEVNGPNYELDFDGKSHVQLPQIDLTGLDGLTIEATVTPRQPPKKDAKGEPTGAFISDKERFGLGLLVKERGLIFEVGTKLGDGTASHEFVWPGVPWTMGTQRVAGVIDVKNKTAAFFVNGRQIERKPFKGDFTGGPTPFMLGADPGLGGAPNNFFAGRLDEVRLSSIARYSADYDPVQGLAADQDTLALYHCDEGAGEVLIDSSPHKRHGRIVGAKWVNQVDSLSPTPATVDAPGIDHELEFDGVNDYVAVPTLMPDCSHPLTIEATLSVVVPYTETTCWLSNFGVKESASCLTAYTRDGRFGLALTGSKWTIADSPAFSTGRYRVAAARDDRFLRFFLDGKLVQESPLQNSDLPSPSKAYCLIGAEGTSDGDAQQYFFRGRIDELRISKAARYTADYAPVPRLNADADTLALYHFDEGAGEVLRDSSGHNHHGKIVGATWAKVAASEPVPQPVPAPVLEPVKGINLQGQDDAYPWVLDGGRTIYFTRDSEGSSSTVVRASRKSVDVPFETPQTQLNGRMMATTDDELYAVLLPGAYQAGVPLHQSTRLSRSELWGDPAPLAPFTQIGSVKSPWISGDGLTLVFQRARTSGPIAKSSSEFVVSRRASRTSAWSEPALLPMKFDAALDDTLTWPCLSNGMLDLWFCVGGTRSPRVFRAHRDSLNQPFGSYQPVKIADEPLLGRSPRWVAAEKVLYLSRDRDPSVKDADIEVLRNADFQN